MWKYKYTDELYHKQHKYIKRVKVNGKWRYYYKDNKKNGNRTAGEAIKDWLGVDERGAAGDAVREYNNATANLKGYRQTQNDPTKEKYYSPGKEALYAADVARKGKAASKALSKYYKTPLGKLDKLDDMIDSGRKKISKFLNKIAKAISPKKESITKYSKKKK